MGPGEGLGSLLGAAGPHALLRKQIAADWPAPLPAPPVQAEQASHPGVGPLVVVDDPIAFHIRQPLTNRDRSARP